MRNRLPLTIATLSGFCIVLVLNLTLSNPVENWRQGELVVILPPEDSLDHQFNRQLAELFANQLKVKLKTIELYPYQVSNALEKRLAHLSAIGARRI